MDNDQYITTQFMLLNIAHALTMQDIDAFLERIAKARALAPVLDPTLYRLAEARMSSIESIARILGEAKRKIVDLNVLEELMTDET